METLNTLIIIAGAVLVLLLILAPVFIYQCAAYARRIWRAQEHTNRLLAEQTAVTQKLIEEIEAARNRASKLRRVG